MAHVPPPAPTLNPRSSCSSAQQCPGRWASFPACLAYKAPVRVCPFPGSPPWLPRVSPGLPHHRVDRARDSEQRRGPSRARPGPGLQHSTQARTQRGVPGGWLIWGGLWKLLTQLCTHPNPPGAGPLSPASGRGSGSSPLPALFPADVLSGLQFSSVAQSCLTLCDPIDRSTPGLPVHHQFPESTQTHVHWVSDAIQPSHSLPSPSPPVLNLSQHQGLF